MKQQPKNKPIRITKAQLKLFAQELEEAGSFDNLMIKKKAIERDDYGKIYTFTYKDIEMYKDIHLCGVYEKLRPYFNTRVPYAFWSQLYVGLKRSIASYKQP
jgi:hypothetical protein